MRCTRFLLIACAGALFAELSSAQLTLINRGRTGPAYATSTGTALKIDTNNKVFGRASVTRQASPANSSYLPTGIALDPNSSGTSGCTTPRNGFTIMFWYRPGQATTFSYLFGDNTWLGASGAFRCFQNGAANTNQGAGNLYMRGPLGQKRTTTGPLVNALNTNGWIHLAIAQHNTSPTSGTLTWYVNGLPEGAGSSSSTATTKGTNLTCMGYNGSSSAGVAGEFDDFRVYNWARTAANIAADYNSWPIAGRHTNGCFKVPDEGYYWCDASVNPHIAKCELAREPGGSFTRLFTTGDGIAWEANSPATGPFAAICVMNLFTGPLGSKQPRQDAYQQPPDLPSPPGPFTSAVVPGLVLASIISTPAYPSLFWPQAVLYGNNTPGKTGFTVPALGFVDGDRIDLQWIVLDSTYPPAGFGTTANMTFEFITPVDKYGVHFDVRGINTIQDTGFFEVWNTGSVPITKLVLDFTPVAPSTVWSPAGLLNSGGTLSGGDSFRHLTDEICSLTPKTGTRYNLDSTNKILTFDFLPPSVAETGFQGPQNHFIFDCDTVPTGTGRAYLGATIEATFLGGKTLKGPLVADPSDPNGAHVSLKSN